MPYLDTFHENYSNINIEIITNRPSELLNKLKNGLIDVVVMNLANKKYDNDIEILKIKEVQDTFVVGNKYKYLLNKKLTLSDLNKYPLIVQAKGSNTRAFLDSYLSELNIGLNFNIELSSYTLVGEFSKIGMGIGYVTKEFIKKELANKELYELKIKEDIPKRYIGIALSKNHLPNFSTKKLLEIITKKENQ